MKLIIDIPEEIYESQRYAQYFGAWSVVLQKHFENGTPIPDNATNEEAIRALFPYTIFVENRSTNRIVISKDWWNAPYQKGGKERNYDVECRNHSEMILNAQKGGKE